MTHFRSALLLLCAFSLAACGDDDGVPADASVADLGRADLAMADLGRSDAGGDVDAGAVDGGAVARPHPLYPSLDLDSLPGPGGGASGPYEPPILPTTTRTVTVSTTGAQARMDLIAACAIPGTAVTVADAAGRIGALDLGNVTDCDITLGAAVIVDFVAVGHLPGPVVAPAHRVRLRGGQLGSIFVDPGSSDIVFDGVVINNAVMPPAERNSTAILLNGDAGEIVNRFAFVNSIVRMVATLPNAAGDTDGCAYLAGGARNVFFANDNIVTAGNRNAWGFRISGGENQLFVDNTVRVSFHKLIRMNDGPVDYVYVRGGTWMREATLSAGLLAINDSFAQLGDLGTDHIYIHDTAIHLLSTETVGFGASFGPGQVGKLWEARRIAWHARSASVVSDEVLMNYQSFCTAGALCDYGVGTHTYAYDAAISFPADPWRALPGIAVDDPDLQPIAP